MEGSHQPQTTLEELYDAVDLSKRNITDQIVREGRPIGMGAFADVVRGTWNKPVQHADPTTGRLMTSIETHQIAIKDIRVFDKRHPTWTKIINRLFHEIGIWCWLDHVNILPFYGYSLDVDGRASLISPWYKHGSLPDFLKENPETSRADLVLDVAEGLAYLHNHFPPIIHGDLKGGNILVNEHGVASISDFGISMFVEGACVLTGFTTTSDLRGGSIRWMAPELFQFGDGEQGDQEEDNPRKTFASDMYAFGGVLLEIQTGKAPYHYLTSDASVLVELHQKRIPRFDKYEFGPSAVALQEILRALWSFTPCNRPSAQMIANTLYIHYSLHPREKYVQVRRTSCNIGGETVRLPVVDNEIDRSSLWPANPAAWSLSRDGTMFCRTIDANDCLKVELTELIPTPTLRWFRNVPLELPSNNSLFLMSGHKPPICVWNPSSSLVVSCIRRPGAVPLYSTIIIDAHTGILHKVILPVDNVTAIHQVAFTAEDTLVFALSINGSGALVACKLSVHQTSLQPPHKFIWLPQDVGRFQKEPILSQNGVCILHHKDSIDVTTLSGEKTSVLLHSSAEPSVDSSRHHDLDSALFISQLSGNSYVTPDNRLIPELVVHCVSVSVSAPTLSGPRDLVLVTEVEVQDAITNSITMSSSAQHKGWLIAPLRGRPGILGIWHCSTPYLFATATILAGYGHSGIHFKYPQLSLSVHEGTATVIACTPDLTGGNWYLRRFRLPPIPSNSPKP